MIKEDDIIEIQYVIPRSVINKYFFFQTYYIFIFQTLDDPRRLVVFALVASVIEPEQVCRFEFRLSVNLEHYVDDILPLFS